MAEPHDDYETKASALRALYRQHKPAILPHGRFRIIDQAGQDRQQKIVLAEYARLFGRSSWDLDLGRSACRRPRRPHFTGSGSTR